MVFSRLQHAWLSASIRTRQAVAFGLMLLLACVLVCASSAARAQTMPHLRDIDRVRLAEAFRLGDALQERVWQGWSKAPFAVLLITPEYEFLVRHPHPSNDFVSAGNERMLGGPVFYRKRTFATNLLATFPAVNGLSTIVVGEAENTQSKTSTPWVVTLLHEHFHQWQDSQPHSYDDVAALDLARGDTTGMWMLNYAFPYSREDVNAAFSTLAQALAAALHAVHTPDFKSKLAAYRSAQQQFRQLLPEADYRYFQFQLWKEGVARYTEYRVATLAAKHYAPGKDFADLKDYTPYAQTAAALYNGILKELPAMSLEKSKRVAFYAVGAGEALLLDTVSPRWQSRYLQEKFDLDAYFEKVNRPQQGRLNVPDLPSTAHVYVDGKPAAMQKGTVAVSAGWHELQVEAELPGKGLMAFRRPVEVTPNRTANVLVVWHRVTLGLIENGTQAYFPPGAPGPAGEPGPAARPFQPLPARPEAAALRKPLQEARDILVDDLLARTQDAVNSLSQLAAPTYVYAPEGNVAAIPGDSGPIGPQGPPGLPAEVPLIRTAQGMPFQAALTRTLGLQGREQALSKLEDRLKRLSTTSGAPAVPIKPFRVLTPEWKAALDRQRTAALAIPRPQNGIYELPNIQGPAGAPGRRGADGVPPADAMPIRLTPEQEKALLTVLEEDKGVQEKVKQIQALLRELDQRVYLAEGLHLEQFPPSLSAPRPPR